MKRREFALVLTLVAMTGTGTALAQYDLSWWTVDGGGAMFSTGGPFELGGTIGQPDAQTAPVMTGGGYVLTGGFWPAPTPPFPPGDMNCDGAVNGQDIDGFILVLLATDAPIYADYHAWGGIVKLPCNAFNGDMNGDGNVNGQDIDGFVAALLGV